MATQTGNADSATRPTFIDIGLNLADPMFRGQYHGKQSHEDDLAHVIARAKTAGVTGAILTGGNLSESAEALDLAIELGDGFYSTVGCHPTRTQEMESHAPSSSSSSPARLAENDQAEGAETGPQAYLDDLGAIISSSRARGKVVAIGECGLDYDRLHFSPACTQRPNFEAQLSLAKRFQLPLFLHSRAAHRDFVDILAKHVDSIHAALSASMSNLPPADQDKEPVQAATYAPHPTDPKAKRVGVVHSFTGTVEEVKELLDLGLFIGINGCSLKTQENLNVVKHIPLDRIMLETDAPWCDPRSTHASAALIGPFKSSNPELYSAYQPGLVKKEKWSPTAMVKGRNEPCVIGLIAACVAGVHDCSIEQVAEAARRNTEWLFGVPSLSPKQS
ncbi:hypothetical protein BCV70DRAFT_199530 [Testicularia cyperi]|uniref:Mg-dependent DNase n=1 Tax=Testicularia cyperi TaxID=1882483 RepID=A0A317XS65_9BASI|nr:hypothetical protein BCV70DRAFT_199530 [Testicularia cyperi]